MRQTCRMPRPRRGAAAVALRTAHEAPGAHAAHHRRPAGAGGSFAFRRAISGRRPIGCARRCSTGCRAAHRRARAAWICIAGSGALGLEALSRGAAAVRVRRAATRGGDRARALLRDWSGRPAAAASCCADARALPGAADAARAFDLVFLDPPFGSRLALAASAQLEARGWLAADAPHLCRASRGASRCRRCRRAGRHCAPARAGEVGYHLYARAAEGAGREAAT